MATQQIPQSEWNEFLATLSAKNQTRKVTVDVQSAELGPQRVVTEKSLISVEPDLKDEHEPTITVIVGDPEGGEPMALTHQVMNPQSIWVKEDDGGRIEALDIETEDGRTILQFV